jgi:hypothetical protein
VRGYNAPVRFRSFLSRVLGTQLQLPLFQAAPPAPALPRITRPLARPHEPSLQSHLEASLRADLRRPVTVTVHDNRSTMISFRHVDDRIVLRVHRMFLSADRAIVQALADFAGRRRKRVASGQLLDAFIRAHQQDIRPSRPQRCEPRGRFHDLEASFRALNARFFDGTIEAAIGWSRAPRAGRRRRRTIKMGLYMHDQKAIRIHPALDRAEVPAYVLEFIVYHEMLHQACPPERGASGRQRIHTPAFRAREKLHPDRERALLWEKKNLNFLLRPVPDRD